MLQHGELLRSTMIDGNLQWLCYLSSTSIPFIIFISIVFHSFGQYFCLYFEAFQLGMAPVYMAFLHFMGDEAEARNYS
ncbi:E3 ubiquitin-protein ligase SINAT5-like [Gossypium australe]|uniref:E3 ubiquitin-protein ligase SINAT5-like n=1 Tax=Gossypium australe TaxID=47621 RepID=A0A5B6WGA1_9ROSI|nr:E3 ubiquitin-protein ligase SINAT5-like [Gossypium australe]